MLETLTVVAIAGFGVSMGINTCIVAGLLFYRRKWLDQSREFDTMAIAINTAHNNMAKQLIEMQEVVNGHEFHIAGNKARLKPSTKDLVSAYKSK